MRIKGKVNNVSKREEQMLTIRICVIERTSDYLMSNTFTYILFKVVPRICFSVNYHHLIRTGDRTFFFQSQSIRLAIDSIESYLR